MIVLFPKLSPGDIRLRYYQGIEKTRGIRRLPAIRLHRWIPSNSPGFNPGRLLSRNARMVSTFPVKRKGIVKLEVYLYTKIETGM